MSTNLEYTLSRLVGAICPYCDKGWDLGSVADSHKDRVLGLVHSSCARRHHGILDRQLYSKVCIRAGFRHKGWLKHANTGAYGGPHNSIWESVPASDDLPMSLKFGRRKRVWTLSVESRYTPKSERPEWPSDFLETKSTREHNGTSVMVHAWTEDELQGYVNEVVEHIGRWPKVAA